MSDEFNSNNTEKIYSLDIPAREGKEGFIGTHFTLILQIGNMISRIGPSENSNLHYLTSLLISCIPDKKDRAVIRKEIEDEFNKRIDSKSTNEDKLKIRNAICIESVGSVMDYIDKHVGVSRENKIGFCIPKKENENK